MINTFILVLYIVNFLYQLKLFKLQLFAIYLFFTLFYCEITAYI